MSVLHRAGSRWVDLGPQIVAATNRGTPVMWVSFSGTVQIFATVDGVLTRARQGSPATSHAWDGLALLVEHPFFATACGCGEGSGYRSTAPLLVATVDGADGVAPLFDDAMAWGRRLAAGGYDLDLVPMGHPHEPCGALYCPQVRQPGR